MVVNIPHRVILLGFGIVLAGLLTSCQKDPADPEPDKPLTWFDSFARALDDSLKIKKIGYGFVILEGSEVRASGRGGLKSLATDPEGEKPFTLDTKMHIASMSKTITTMAFLHLAAEKAIKTTDRIAPYLPPAWAKGANIGQVTFRDLLTHRSGIIGLTNSCANGAYSENTWSGLQQLIQKGVSTANRGSYCYQNANFSLFRVLIPAMLGYLFTGNEFTDDQQTQRLYTEYVQKNVFENVGLTRVVTTQPPGDPTYAYAYPNAGQTGWNPGGFTTTVGAYGWYLTPAEAGKLFATVLSTADQRVLTSAWKDTLITNRLGNFSGTVSDGAMHYHDGWWNLKLANYQGLRTVWMKLPNNVTAVLFVNAIHGVRGNFPSDDGNDIVQYLSRAYMLGRSAKSGRKAVGKPVLEQPDLH
ncbi:hypothetical protein GCM10027299_15990 [Larkinella ripae]